MEKYIVLLVALALCLGGGSTAGEVAADGKTAIVDLPPAAGGVPAYEKGSGHTGGVGEWSYIDDAGAKQLAFKQGPWSAGDDIGEWKTGKKNGATFGSTYSGSGHGVVVGASSGCVGGSCPSIGVAIIDGVGDTTKSVVNGVANTTNTAVDSTTNVAKTAYTSTLTIGGAIGATAVRVTRSCTTGRCPNQ